MLLGGLWHGASWNFVLWGAIHGGMLAFERAQGKAQLLPPAAAAAPDRRSPSSSSACPGSSSARRRSGRRSRCSSRCSASRAVTAASDAPAGAMYTRLHVTRVRARGAPRLAGAQHLDLHARGCPLPRAVAALGAARAVDPDDVDAEHEPVPLLPVLMVPTIVTGTDARMTAADTGPRDRRDRGGPTDPSHDADLRRGILRTAVSRRIAWVAGAAVPAASCTRPDRPDRPRQARRRRVGAARSVPPRAHAREHPPVRGRARQGVDRAGVLAAAHAGSS